MKFWILRIKICRFMKIPLEGYFEDETICESKELDLYMSPSSCYLPIHSHLISSIPCPRMEYSPNPTSSFGYLLKGYDCHRLLSICDSFYLDFV